ncbi:fibronectin type III domain protein [Leptospira ryugenii]|uniref:Fibronectin type III domain protein n=1 Tax=Leptospira ryugenii TaxID=1917863 RepID=A0A2P2E4P3_9LEPT|nr:C1 family peptidase [Leptospira ryugenii]GBF51855.1 fibronectin type III domain protein [Leptospira ryugenii]
MKRNGILALTLVSISILSFVGFLSRPIKGDPTNQSPFPTGTQIDPFELFESVPEYKVDETFTLPNQVSLESLYPPPGNQVKQKNSAAFAVGYGLVSFLVAKDKGKKNLKDLDPRSENGTASVYSPAYIYHSLNGGRDQGISLLDALFFVQSRGSVSLREYPYLADTFKVRPNANLIEVGRQNRIEEIQKVNTTQIKYIKYLLAKEKPVVTNILCFDDFLQFKGSSVYKFKNSKQTFGAQSVVVIGYDDDLRAFRILNSWGKEWGDQGYAWIDYTSFQQLTQIAYTAILSRDRFTLQKENDLFELLESDAWQGIAPPKDVYASKGEFENKIRVVWTKVPQVIGYEIYRRRKNEKKFELVGLSRSHSFEDFGVQKNQTYTYRIVSLTEEKSSKPSHESNESFASTEQKITELLPITNLEASKGIYNDRILLTWDPHLSADQYSIYKWNASSKLFKFLGKTNQTKFIDFKASKNGDVEVYRVVPSKGNLMADGSSYAGGYLDPLQQLRNPPDQIFVSKGELNRQILVRWNEIPAAKNYLVLRTKSGESDWGIIARTKETEFIDSDFSQSDYLYAIVVQFEDLSYSLPSKLESGYVNLTAARGERSKTPLISFTNDKKQGLMLRWNQLKNVESYQLYVRTKENKKWNLLRKIDANETEIPIPDLSKQTFHFLALTAKESNKEESFFSNSLVYVQTEPVKDLKKVRTFGESNLSRFLGPWTAMYWDGKSSVKPIKLDIESLSDDEFVLKWNQKEFFRGSYIIDALLIEEKGKWKIQLSNQYDSLSAEVYEKDLLPEKSRLSFVRE